MLEKFQHDTDILSTGPPEGGIHCSPSLLDRGDRRNPWGYGITAVILEILQYPLDVYPCLLIRGDAIISKDSFLPGIIGC